MFFREIYGQTDLKRRLIAGVRNGRVPHAQLLAGADGAGTLALAIAYAQYIACENKSEEDSCGVCPSCKKFEALSHTDLQMVFPIVRDTSTDTSMSQTYMDEMREMLKKSPYFNLDDWTNSTFKGNKQPVIYNDEITELIRRLGNKAGFGEYKMVIIWHPELITAESANRILKNIEEPQGKTVFLLVSDRPEDILGTILSRTQRIVVPRLSDKEVESAIKTLYPEGVSDIKGVARAACGDVAVAKQWIEDAEGAKDKNGDVPTDDFGLFCYLMRMVYSGNVLQMKLWMETVGAFTRKRQVAFLQYSQRMLRESYVARLREEELLFMTTQESGFSSKFSAYITDKNIYPMMEELQKAENHIQRNLSGKIVFFDMAMKLATAFHKK